MSDLQCPATVVLVCADRAPTTPDPSLITQLDELHCAAVQVTSGADANRWAKGLAEASGLTPRVVTEIASIEQLFEAVSGAADLFRGETLAIVSELEPTVAGATLRPGDWVVLSIDGDGWRLKPSTATHELSALASETDRHE